MPEQMGMQPSVPQKRTDSPSLASVTGTPKTLTKASRRNYESKNSTDNRPSVLYLNVSNIKSVSQNINKLPPTGRRCHFG